MSSAVVRRRRGCLPEVVDLLLAEDGVLADGPEAGGPDGAGAVGKGEAGTDDVGADAVVAVFTGGGAGQGDQGGLGSAAFEGFGLDLGRLFGVDVGDDQAGTLGGETMHDAAADVRPTPVTSTRALARPRSLPLR
jgi:hypothetical protein